MKDMTTVILWLIFVAALISCVHAKEGPEIDQSKPIYQKAWGRGKVIVWPFGGVEKVRIPDPKTVNELRAALRAKDMKHEQEMNEVHRENKAREHTFGSWMKRIGWVLLALGFAGHGSSALGPLKSMASSIMTLGFVGIAAGIGLQKTVEYESPIALAILGPIGLVVLWRGRNWSIFKWAKESVSKLRGR